MSYDPSDLKWVKITKTFSDFSTASVTNAITIYSLSSKQLIHSTQIVVTTTFSGGTIATYTISIGTGGNATKYSAATNVFTGASLPAISTSAGLESTSGATNILATAISTIGNLSAATQGSVDIYLLISNLP